MRFDAGLATLPEFTLEATEDVVESKTGNYTVCKDQCVDEGTNVHSGFTRHMTAAAATLNRTTPRAVEYCATNCKPDLVPGRERATTFDLQCLSEVHWDPPGSSLDVAAPPWRKLVKTLE